MTEILVEISTVDASGNIRPNFPRVDDLTRRLDEVGEAIGEIARRLGGTVANAMKSDGLQKDRGGVQAVEVTFKVALKADAGVVIQRVGAEAAFEVRVCWNKTGVNADG